MLKCMALTSLSPALFNIALESVVIETLVTASGVKIGIYKLLILAAYALVRHVVLYACGAWSTTKSDELKLATFERMIFKGTYGPKINSEAEYEIRTNQEI